MPASRPKPNPPASRWQKGQSGNPTGRSKASVELQSLARAHTPEAFAALVRVIRSKHAPDAAVVSAAREILDRGWGRPALPVTGDLGFGRLVEALEARRSKASAASGDG